MADLSKLSDAELMELAGIKQPASNALPKQQQAAAAPAPTAVDFSKLSNEELAKLAYDIDQPKEPKGVVESFFDKVDSYTRAPLRAGFNELVRTEPEFGREKPSFFGNLVSAGKAAASQFGEDPALAPTGKEIAEKRFGLSGEPLQAANTSFLAAKGGVAPEAARPEAITVPTNASPAGMAGVGIDESLDVTNLIPVTAVAKVGSQATKGAARFALKGSAAALEKLPGGRGIKNIAEGTAKLIDNFARPKVAKDFKNLAEVAAKNGVDISKAPEAIEFGKDSTISRIARAQTQTALGEPRFESAREFFGQVTDAYDNKLAEISKGPALPPAEAGVHLKQSFDKAVSNFFKQNEVRYSKIAAENVGTPISQTKFNELTGYLETVAKDAEKAIARNFSPQQTQQAQMLLNKINSIWKEAYTIDGAVDVLKNIGDVAFPKSPQGLFVGPDLKRTRDLYFKLRDTIIDSIEEVVPNGAKIADDLRKTNQNITKFMRTIEPIERTLGNSGLAPEQVFNQVTRTSDQIQSLKEVLNADDFARLKGSILETALGARNEEGFVSFTKLRKTFQNPQKRAVFERLFTPDEAKEVLDIARLGEAAGNPILNTSRTSEALNLQNLKDTLINAFISEPTLEGLKSRARSGALRLPVEPPKAGFSLPQLGPKGISPQEAIGLRLPQQITTQKRNQNKERGR